MNIAQVGKVGPLLAEFADLRVALEVSDYQGAIEHLQTAFNALMEQERFENALVLHEAILQSLPDGSTAAELRLWCLLGVGNAYFHLDQDTAAADAYEQMRSEAQALGDDFLRSVALTRLGDLARKQDEREGAVKFYHEGIKAKLEAGDICGVVEIFLWLAVLAEDAGQWQQASEALAAAGDMLKIFRRAVVRKNNGDTFSAEQAYNYWKMALWFQQASLQRAQGNLLEAQRIFRTALRSARTQHDMQAEAKLLQNLANGLVEQGLVQKAIPLYEDSLKIAQENRLSDTIRQVHQGLAIALFRLKRYTESLPYYEAARLDVKDADQNLWASLTGDTGALYIELGDFEKGIALLGQALIYFQSIGDIVWQERILRNFLVADARQKKEDRFQVRLHECLNLLPQSAYQARRSLYRFAGNLYLDVLMDAQSAARCFRQAVEEELAGGESSKAGETAALTGAALSQGGAPREALALFDRAAKIFTADAHETNLWRTRNDRGIALSHIGDYEEAAEEFAWCLQTAVERQDRPQEAQALLNLGEVERLIGEVKEAIFHEEQALMLYQAMDDQQGELDALNALGLCLIEEHRLGGDDHTEEVFPLFERALRLAKRLKSTSQEAMATRGLARVAERRGQVAAALRFYRRAAALWEREEDYSHCAEALAACVTLEITELNPRQWQEDVEHLLQVAIKGGVVGKAAHGIVGAALHLIKLGDLETAAEFVRLALTLHQHQMRFSSPTLDQKTNEDIAGDDFYRTIAFLVDAMENYMAPEERAQFLEIVTRSDNSDNPLDGNSLRETIEQIRDELINEGFYEQKEQ